MSHLRAGSLLALLLAAALARAAASDGASTLPDPLQGSKVYLEITPHGRGDLEALFDTLEESVAADEPQTQPVVIVLHGPEALPFIRRNYLENRAIVDQAAKLEAFDRIELRMCETWMRENGFGQDDLLPFIEPVPLAPAEVERLEQDGYLPYDESMSRSGLL